VNRRGEQRTHKTKRGRKTPFFKYLKTVSTPTIITAVTYGKITMNGKKFDSELRKYVKEQSFIQ
jgi:hypothetical protein